jgi:hypothetical protein
MDADSKRTNDKYTRCLTKCRNEKLMIPIFNATLMNE